MGGSQTRSLIALVAVVVVAMTGFGVFLPIFPFLGMSTGAGPTAITIAMGAYSLGQLISSPLWGRLSDRIGRKPVLIIGLVGSALSYLMLAHATTIWEMFGARLFGGLMAGNVGAAFAAAADLADDKTRARNMGLLGAAFGFGFIMGPAIGAFLIGASPTQDGFHEICEIAAAFAALACVVAITLFVETLPPESRRDSNMPRVRRWTLLRTRPLLARFIFITLAMITAQAAMETSFSLWVFRVFDWGPRPVGWTLAGFGVGAALLQGGGAGRAARTAGEPRTLVIGLALFAVGMGVAAIFANVWGALALGVALTLGAGLATPALQSLVAGQANDNDRGAVMGLSQSASALGRVLGPLCSGALFEHVSISAPFAFGAVLLVIALAAQVFAKD